MRDFSSSETSDYTLRKAIKKLKKQQTAPPIMKQDDYWARSDHEKVDIFAEYFVKLSTLNAKELDPGEKMAENQHRIK